MWACLRKEWLAETRSRAGLMSAGLFSVSAVVAVWFASFGFRLPGGLAAGLLWVTLLFSAVVALPRVLLAEEENGTGDLLRQWARPQAVFWGKALFNSLQMVLTALALTVLFLVLTDLQIRHPLLLALSLAAGCSALAAGTTLCGALAAQAPNRAALSVAVSVPFLLPMVALGITAVRVSFGQGDLGGGWQGCLGLACYAVATFSGGPHLFAAVWKR
ncbi:MAG: heme exporter protein CcmB [Fimbriimonadales bacterium]|nr:heme exporter protein CcmB [Fimbriimonadales bacterium]